MQRSRRAASASSLRFNPVQIFRSIVSKTCSGGAAIRTLLVTWATLPSSVASRRAEGVGDRFRPSVDRVPLPEAALWQDVADVQAT